MRSHCCRDKKERVRRNMMLNKMMKKTETNWSPIRRKGTKTRRTSPLWLCTDILLKYWFASCCAMWVTRDSMNMIRLLQYDKSGLKCVCHSIPSKNHLNELSAAAYCIWWLSIFLVGIIAWNEPTDAHKYQHGCNTARRSTSSTAAGPHGQNSIFPISHIFHFDILNFNWINLETSNRIIELLVRGEVYRLNSNR